MTDPGRRRTAALLLAGLVLLAGSHLIDRWGVSALSIPAANDRDWGRLLRILGFAPTWLLVAVGLWLEAGTRERHRAAELRTTAIAVVAAVALGGLGAEALKLLIRRERPDPAVAGYVFRPFSDHPWSTRRLGIPSSHAMVAFAGATALAHRFRRVGPILLLLATGCALTRVFARAHFVSDVVLAAIGGILVGGYVARRLDRQMLEERVR